MGTEAHWKQLSRMYVYVYEHERANKASKSAGKTVNICFENIIHTYKHVTLVVPIAADYKGNYCIYHFLEKFTYLNVGSISR